MPSHALPLTSAHFARGELSYSKVRALTRVATPANEADLLQVALYGTASHVEKTVRLCRRAARSDIASEARVLYRSLETYYDEDGMLVLRARLAPEDGALLLSALAAARETLRAEARAAADAAAASDDVAHRSRDAHAHAGADALALVARRALTGEGSAAADAERYQVVVHVDAEVLAHPTAPGRSELEGGPDVSEKTSRRLCCDGAVVPMWHGPRGQVLDVGRRTRTISPGLRRALRERDGGCRFPGCSSRIREAEGVLLQFPNWELSSRGADGLHRTRRAWRASTSRAPPSSHCAAAARSSPRPDVARQTLRLAPVPVVTP